MADLPPRDHVHEIVVIGGGVAGVSCAKELARLSSNNSITLISASETLVEVILCYNTYCFYNK